MTIGYMRGSRPKDLAATLGSLILMLEDKENELSFPIGSSALRERLKKYVSANFDLLPGVWKRHATNKTNRPLLRGQGDEILTLDNCSPSFPDFEKKLKKWKKDGYFNERYEGGWELSSTVLEIINKEEFKKAFQENCIDTVDDLIHKIRNRDRMPLMPERGKYNWDEDNLEPDTRKYDLGKRFSSLRFSLPVREEGVVWLDPNGFTLNEYEAGYYSREVIRKVRSDLSDLWQKTSVVISMADVASGKTTLSSILFHEISNSEDHPVCLRVRIEDRIAGLDRLKEKLSEAVELVLTESNKRLYILMDDVHSAWSKTRKIIDRILEIPDERDRERVKIFALSRPSSSVQEDIDDKNPNGYKEYKFPGDYARELLSSYLKAKGENILDYKETLRPLLEHDSNIFSLLSGVDPTMSLENYVEMIIKEIHEEIPENEYYCMWVLFSLSIFRRLEIPLEKVDFLRILQAYFRDERERELPHEALTFLKRRGYLNLSLLSENLYLITIHPYVAGIIVSKLEEGLKIAEEESSEDYILTEWLKKRGLDDYKMLKRRLDKRDYRLFPRLNLAKIEAHKSLLDSVEENDYRGKAAVYYFLEQSPSYENKLELSEKIFGREDIEDVFRTFRGEEETSQRQYRHFNIKSMRVGKEVHTFKDPRHYLFLSNERGVGEFLSHLAYLDGNKNFVELFNLLRGVPSKFLDESTFRLFSPEFMMFFVKSVICLKPEGLISLQGYQMCDICKPLINSRPDISWNGMVDEVANRVVTALRNFECNISFIPEGDDSDQLGESLYYLASDLSKEEAIQNIFEKVEVPSKDHALQHIGLRSGEELFSYLAIISIEFPLYYRKLVSVPEIKEALRVKIEKEITDAIKSKDLGRFFTSEERDIPLRKFLVLYHLEITIEIETYTTFDLLYDLFSVFLLLLIDNSQLTSSLRKLPFANWHNLMLTRRVMRILENKQKEDGGTIVYRSEKAKQRKESKFADLREAVEQSDIREKIALIGERIGAIFRELSDQEIIESINEMEVITPELLDRILNHISSYREQTNFELYKLLEGELTLVLERTDKNPETSELFINGYFYEEKSSGGISLNGNHRYNNDFPFHQSKPRRLHDTRYREEQTKYEVLRERIWSSALSSNLSASSKGKVYKHFVEVCCNSSKGRKISLWIPKLDLIDISLLVTSLIEYGDLDRLAHIYDFNWIRKIEDERQCKALLKKVTEHVATNKQNDLYLPLNRLLLLIAEQYLKLFIKGDAQLDTSIESLVTKCFDIFSRLYGTPNFQLRFLEFLNENVLIKKNVERHGNESWEHLFNMIDIETIVRLFLIDMRIVSIYDSDSPLNGRKEHSFPYLRVPPLWANILECKFAKELPGKLMQTIDFSYYPKEQRGTIYLFLDYFFKDHKLLIKRLRGEAKELQNKNGELYLLNPLYWGEMKSDGIVVTMDRHIYLMCNDESVRSYLRDNFQDIIVKMNQERNVYDLHLLLLIKKLWESENSKVTDEESYNSQIDDEFSSENFSEEIKNWKEPSLIALYNILCYHHVNPRLARKLIPRTIVIQQERERLELALFYDNSRVLNSIFRDNNDSVLEEILQPFRERLSEKKISELMKTRAEAQRRRELYEEI